MSNLYVPPCPTTCAGSLPDVDFSECTPIYHWGEISYIYMAPITLADFVDVSALGEWTTNLSQTADDKIRKLTVIGEKPEPEIAETPTSGDRIAVGPKKHLINFEIDETGDINYNFMLMSECAGKYKIWYETSDGILYGGNTGIESTVRMNQIHPRGRPEIVKIVGKATWNALQSPFRCDSPMY